MNPSDANPIDVQVGHRIRAARKMIGMSQEALASKLDVSFQQVQKYESGANRISASMLWMTAVTVNQPVSYFFDGLDGIDGNTEALEFQKRAMEMATLCPSLLRINELSAKQRGAITDLIESMLTAA